jgi:signal transduction histidine kinase
MVGCPSDPEIPSSKRSPINAKQRRSGGVAQILFLSRSLIVGAIALVMNSWSVNAQGPPRRVLVLYPYDNAAPFTERAGAAIRKRLIEKSSSKIEIHTDFLDLARFPAEADELRSAHYLAEKYARTPPDVIMPLGTEAHRFALKYREILGPGIPIVFCCVTPELAHAADRPKDVTGNYGEFDAGKTIDLAQRLQPKAKNLIIISGSSEIDGRWMAELKKEIAPYESRYNTEYWIGVQYETMLDRVAHVLPETIIIFVTVYRDGTGRSFVPADVVEGLARVAAAPMYGPSDTYLARGVVGGYMDSFDLMGSGAADIALEVLVGKDPNAIGPPRLSQSRKFQVDARQLLRWNLSEKNLPKDTVLSFKQPTLWEEHRNIVLATIFVILLQAILITALLIQIVRRRRAEAASRATLSDLARVTRLTTIGEMTASIAHEINQPLGAIVTNGEAGLRWLGNATPDLGEARAALTRIVSNGYRASQVINRIRGMLKKDTDTKVLLDLSDLIGEVASFVHGEIRDHKIVLRTELNENLPKVFGDRIQLQQVVLNLVLNGIDAMSSVSDRERVLKLRSEQDGPSSVMLTVEDAGKGIDADAHDRIFEAFFTTKAHGMGMGLSICRSIITSHGGRLLVSAGHPHGAVFRVELPAHRSGAA